MDQRGKYRVFRAILRRSPSATAVLVLLTSTGALAAPRSHPHRSHHPHRSRYVITSIQQISPRVRGLLLAGQETREMGLTGLTGPPGAQGFQGLPGPRGLSG